MQLIRLGDLRGLNLDMLVRWEVEAPPDPEPASAPEGETPPTLGTGMAAAPAADAPTSAPPVATTATVQTPTAAPAPATAPAEAAEPARPPLKMTLTLACGGAMETLPLEGAEAEAMRDYLQSKSGALIRAR